MSALERFENMLQSQMRPGSKAIHAAAKRHPLGYSAWIQKQIADTSGTAAGFDQARSKLEAAGLTRTEALRETSRVHPGHGLWIEKQNEERRTRGARGQAAPAPARSSSGSTARGANPYTAAVTRYQSAGSTRAQAIIRAAREYPEAHAAWIDGHNENGAAEEQPLAAPCPAPVIVAAPQLAASSTQRGAPRALTTEELSAQRERWEKFPALRAVYGDDFGLLVANAEGKITLAEVRALREATATQRSREMWANWEASRRRPNR